MGRHRRLKSNPNESALPPKAASRPADSLPAIVKKILPAEEEKCGCGKECKSFNSEAFIKRMAPSIVADFNSLCQKPAPPPGVSDIELKIAQSSSDNNEIQSLIFKHRDCKLHPGFTPEEFAAFLTGAKRLLAEKHLFNAFEIFSSLAADYLIDYRGQYPHDLGLEAVTSARTIARAWVTAYACAFVPKGFDMAQFSMFASSREITDDRNGILYPPEGIRMLEKLGEMEDMAAIHIIGDNCGSAWAELYCGVAHDRIRARSGILLALSGLDLERKKELGIPNNLTDLQLSNLASFLFCAMNIGHILSAFPYAKMFGLGIAHPLFLEESLEGVSELLARGLGKSFKMEAPFSGTNFDTDSWNASQHFLLEQGLIQKAEKAGALILTEKGKTLVNALVQEIAQFKTSEFKMPELDS